MAQAVVNGDKDRLTKIARMVAYDVPHTQIAAACGISESRVSQLLETDEFKEVLQILMAERFEQNKSINDGWDAIEATALNSILEKLQWMSDPDFALKAAMMANRAQRRGQFNNRPLDGRDGVRAVVHLKAQFIEKMQQNTVNVANGNGNTENPVLQLQKRNGATAEQKREDFLPPEKIEKMFMPDDEKAKQLLDFFPVGEMVMAE